MHQSMEVKSKERGEGKVFAIPDWVWEFHGHRCPFMPIGYRMGKVAMEKLGMGKVKDHGAFALSEMGIGHPQTCMMDGIQAITGCTYGKLMMKRLNYGKVAMVLHSPGKGSVRVSALPEFLDELGKKEFFAFRKKGIEPSEIPPSVVEDAVRLVLELLSRTGWSLLERRFPSSSWPAPFPPWEPTAPSLSRGIPSCGSLWASWSLPGP